MPLRIVENAYDGVYRLISESINVVTASTRLTTYAYDRAGNRIQRALAANPAVPEQGTTFHCIIVSHTSSNRSLFELPTGRRLGATSK